MSRLAHWQSLGFDESRREGCAVRIRCSQCQPCLVNGIPLHERGCPHDTHECAGCNTRVPTKVKYCEDCQVMRDLGAFQIIEQRAAGYALLVLLVVSCMLYPWSPQPIPAARETKEVRK